VADLQPPAQALEYVGDIASRHGVDLPEPSGPRAGLLVAESNGQSLSVSPDGRYELVFGEPNAENYEALSTEDAKSRATELIGEHGLDADVDIDFDVVRRTMVAGGAPEGDERSEPRVLETTVQFRQVINGLTVVSQDAGDVRITLDNDGKLVRIENTTRNVQDLTDRAKSAVPGPDSGYEGLQALGDGDPESLLAQAWGNHRARAAQDAATADQAEVAPGTTEVGYHFDGNEEARRPARGRGRFRQRHPQALRGHRPDRGVALVAQEAVMPVELYRLTGADLEVQYWRHRQLSLEFGDAALRDLSGKYEAKHVTEPGIGIRADTEVVADGKPTITFTLLVPEVTWTHMESPPVDVAGVLIITRAAPAVEDTSYPHQRYEARQLTGTAAWRVWPGA